MLPTCRAIGALLDAQVLSRAIGPSFDAKALNRVIGLPLDAKTLAACRCPGSRRQDPAPRRRSVTRPWHMDRAFRWRAAPAHLHDARG